jgi:1-aminocyclopropane-1-carboxylate deaminase/D-cysteine desulfhydrase-like pyridoxal-dependent ACC family enzyme
MNFDIQNITFDELKIKNKEISLIIARLDKIHPVISGNKLFKLYYFLEEVFNSAHKTVLTFGGAFSNHLVATAFACKQNGFKSIGIVRGESPKILSHTLQQCLQYGMQLQFISREAYKNKDDADFINVLNKQYGDFLLVPEGGYHPIGAKGASKIMDLINHKKPTHICTAVGTATTVAGLLLNADTTQQVIAIPVIKNMADIHERISYLTNKKIYDNLTVLDINHFGGYAKNTPELIKFMNTFYKDYKIPTDFIYTAKMMYAIMDKINDNYFANGSTIICLHTGGLQGNLSLPAKTLNFNS